MKGGISHRLYGKGKGGLIVKGGDNESGYIGSGDMGNEGVIK
jgi:hypothetical protein